MHGPLLFQPSTLCILSPAPLELWAEHACLKSMVMVGNGKGGECIEKCDIINRFLGVEAVMVKAMNVVHVNPQCMCSEPEVQDGGRCSGNGPLQEM